MDTEDTEMGEGTEAPRWLGASVTFRASVSAVSRGAAAPRRLFQVAAALVLLALFAMWFRTTPVAVEVSAVERGPLQVSVDDDGETRVRDRFVIAAPVAGWLQRLTLKAGDVVERGTPVARMNPLPLDPRAHAEASARLEATEAAKSAADARVAQARAALDQARRESVRARQLERGGTISQGERERADLEATTREKDMEAALFAARAADFGVVAARAALLAAGGSGSDGTAGVLDLAAPVHGSVLRVLEESERTVAFGTPLLELGDPSSLEIVLDVLTIDAVQIRPGARVLVEEWGGDESLEARVRLVEPSAFTKVSALGVEEQRVNVIADFVEPQPQLGDGYRVEARILVWEGTDILTAPSSALFRHRGEWAVFVEKDGVARRRIVRAGRANPLRFEVLDGLAPGDRVILHPSDLVDDGTRVGASTAAGLPG